MLSQKRSIYFEYDSSRSRTSSSRIVEAHAKYLQANRSLHITLQGNTDERGTREYNIALGQKRADAVKQLMVLLGANEAQIETVSFGKEKPRREGHDETVVGRESPRRHRVRRRVGGQGPEGAPDGVASRSQVTERRARIVRVNIDLRLRPVLAAVALAGLLVTLSARAALFDDDEARKRIDATNARVTQVQKQLEDRMAALEAQLKSQGLVELFSQVEQIKSDVAKLRGQIEVLTYEQDQQQKRQRDLYVDLDSRMRKLEGGGTPPTSAERRAGARGRGPVSARVLESAARRSPTSRRPTTSRSTSSRRGAIPPRSRASARS